MKKMTRRERQQIENELGIIFELITFFGGCYDETRDCFYDDSVYMQHCCDDGKHISVERN